MQIDICNVVLCGRSLSLCGIERYWLEIIGLTSMDSTGSGIQLERSWYCHYFGVTKGEWRWVDVDVFIVSHLNRHVLEFTKVNESLIVVCVYSPNRSTQYPVLFWSLGVILESSPTGDSIVLLGDFNANVGNDSLTWIGGIGRNSFPNINQSGILSLNF